jgi:hypothetical protein
MRSVSSRMARAAVLSLAICVCAAGVALAASSGSYSGKTSQRKSVRFSISSHAIQSFKITVNDKCPDGHTLIVQGHYPKMKIRNRKFGGSFTPVGGHPGEHSSLHGKVGRRAVTGSLSDTSFSNREGALCHGSAKFTAHHA